MQRPLVVNPLWEMVPPPGACLENMRGYISVCCMDCHLVEYYMNLSTPLNRGWLGPKCYVCSACVKDRAVAEVQEEQCCRYFYNCRQKSMVGIEYGWRQVHVAGCKWWVCKNCQIAEQRDWAIRIPPWADPQPGDLTQNEDGLIIVCCHTCNAAQCFFHRKALKTWGWRPHYGLSMCAKCYPAVEEWDQDYRPPPLPFPIGCESSFLATKVVELTKLLNLSRFLPSWLSDLTDDNLRLHGRNWNVSTGERDCGNAAGSILLLAMLCPEEYGVPGAPALLICGSPPHPSIIRISKKRPSSSHGPDNRRTNLVEGLLNPWQGMNREDPLRYVLWKTWFLFGRAEELVDPNRKKRVFENARRTFAITEEEIYSRIPTTLSQIPGGWVFENARRSFAMTERDIMPQQVVRLPEQQNSDGTGEVSSTESGRGVWL